MTGGPIVHQFTAVLAERDALGHHTLAIDDILRSMGASTAIYAAHVHAGLRDRGTDFRTHPADTAPDLILYQASTGTPVADYVLSRPEPVVVDYHNITPSRFFDAWEPHVAAELDHGRRQLARLCRTAARGIADSEYNAAELRELGLQHVDVGPVLFEPFWTDPGSRAAASSSEEITLLFVGRLSPNKAQHDLVGVVAALGARGVRARLVLVGGSASGAYEGAIRSLAERLGVADRVVLTGSVATDELLGWYHRADVFVSVSEHEGFCVPVVEAMALGVPVVAYRSSALPETIGDAGIVVDDKSPAVVAEAIERVLGDDELRSELVGRGRARATQLTPPASVERTREILRGLLAGAR